MRRGAPQLGFPFGARLAPRGIFSDSPFGSPALMFRGNSATNGEGQTGGASFHARLEEPRSQDGERKRRVWADAGKTASVRQQEGARDSKRTTASLGAGRRQAGRWREEWEKRGFRSRPAPCEGLILDVVVGGLANSEGSAVAQRGVCGGRESCCGGRKSQRGGRES